jgi:hypothetical protein
MASSSVRLDDGDAEVLQVVGRKVWQNLVGDLIFAEYCLVAFQAKAPQPAADVHGGTPILPGA